MVLRLPRNIKEASINYTYGICFITFSSYKMIPFNMEKIIVKLN